MFELIAGLVGFVAAGAAAGVGYIKSRDFVAGRLRYVDAVKSPAAPVVAGIAATAVAVPIVAFVPIIGAGTAIAFGAATAIGTRAGVKRIRNYLSSEY